jgi:hypothetical protein
MKLRCCECEKLRSDGFCLQTKLWVLTGYAKLYLSEQCGFPEKASLDGEGMKQ